LSEGLHPQQFPGAGLVSVAKVRYRFGRHFDLTGFFMELKSIGRTIYTLTSAPIWRWRTGGYQVPAPTEVKQGVIRRYALPGAVFIETGTLAGDTAAFARGFSSRVVTIEPSEIYFAAAAGRFSRDGRVKVEHGTSEEVLPRILSEMKGESVTFWLDGHWSGGNTFEGASHTPIREELQAIDLNAGRIGDFVVLIDDARCFDPSLAEFSQYPTRSFLAAWADARKKRWTIEHDIFVIY
jgi:hypothetical protein